MPYARARPRSTTTARPATPACSSSTSEQAPVQLRFPTEPAPARPTARRSSSAGSTGISDVFQPIYNRLREAKAVVYDSETSGLNPRKNFVCGHVLAFSDNPNDSFYLPVRHLKGGNLGGYNAPPGSEAWDGSLHPIEADLIKQLDRPDLTVIGHNLSFDLRVLHHLGLQLTAKYVDTIINAPLLDELQTMFNLAYCLNCAGLPVKKYDIVPYLLEQFPEAAKAPTKAMGHFWKLAGDDEQAVTYAKGDGTGTWALHDYQVREIFKQELARVWAIECRLIPVLARMSNVGIRIDEEKFTQLRIEVKRQIEELQAQFPADFNVRSPLDVKWWCEQAGKTDWPMTTPSLKFPGGQPSFNEKWLETFPAGKQIVDVRKLCTLRDSYLKPLLEGHIINGRVHTTFNQMRGDEFGYITGRISSSEPNLQQASKHNKKIGMMHRSIFVPDDGRLWGTADFSQIEPRLLAYYSRCRVLVNGYNANPPIDAHTSVAIACNRRWDQMNKDERKAYRDAYAKRINQTLLTGGGKKVLVNKYGMDPNEVDQVWADYFRKMPEIRTIQKRMERRMRERGYIITLAGRHCRLEYKDKAYVALNRALQGGNADLIKTAMVEVDDYLASEGRPIDMINTVHDSLDFQFPEDCRPVFDHCMEIMEGVGVQYGVDIPIKVDVGIGDSWATATWDED